MQKIVYQYDLLSWAIGDFVRRKKKESTGFFVIIYTVPAKSHMLCLSLMPAY